MNVTFVLLGAERCEAKQTKPKKLSTKQLTRTAFEYYAIGVCLKVRQMCLFFTEASYLSILIRNKCRCALRVFTFSSCTSFYIRNSKNYEFQWKWIFFQKINVVTSHLYTSIMVIRHNVTMNIQCGAQLMLTKFLKMR